MRWFLSRSVALALVGANSAQAQAASSSSTPQVGIPVTESFTTTPDGVRIHYRVAGSGPDVVMAPFALFHGSALDPLAKGRRVVTYDPRGRGKSGPVALEKVSLDGLLIDLDTVRKAVGADQIAIIGWSGGGMETFVYALRNPNRVTRLVHLAPVTPRMNPYGDQMMQDRTKRTDAAALRKLEERRKAGEFAPDPAAYCRARTAITRPALFFDVSKALMVPDVCTHPNEHPDATGPYFGALFKSIDGYDWRPDLSKVTIPRLVIHPLQDNIPLVGNEEWVRGQPNARILTMDKAGHFPHYEQPQATLAALETFLSGSWPKDARALPAN